jgi:HEAT repeat protein
MEDDVPGAPAHGGGGGGGGFGDGPYNLGGGGDGNFKKGATKPIIYIVGMLMVLGGGIFAFFATKGATEKLDVKDVAKIRNELQLLPKEQQIPKWREWAVREDALILRQEAFAQLAWAKDPEGLNIIIKSLAGADHLIRGTAATALAEYGTPLADKARPELVKAFAEADSGDDRQIAWALAVLKESSQFDRIFEMYAKGYLSKVQRLDQSPAFDPEVLANLSSLDALAKKRTDPSPSVRQLVATALAQTADPKWTDALIELVRDKDIEVGREAAVGLGKIASESAMAPLLDALSRADKDSRKRFLDALRDGVGAQGLVLALRSVSHATPQDEKFQTKVIFDMLNDLHDPRGGDLLVKYIEAKPKPHWKTEAALRLAENGDLRAGPTLGERMRLDPMKIYNQVDEPELRRDDNERVVSARMLADLAVIYPNSHAQLLKDAEDSVLDWLTEKPQPHANGLRFLAASESKLAIPKLLKWSDPTSALPNPGAQPPVPLDWESAQSTLRYLGWTKDPRGWSILEKQLTRQGNKKYDVTMEGLLQGGLSVLGMTLRALGYGAADGFAQWGDSKAFAPLVKYIDDKQGNEQSRAQACFALSWVATEEQMKDVVRKVRENEAPDPKTAFLRSCYLETLIHRPIPAVTAQLLDLIKVQTDMGVRHQAARAMGIGGLAPAAVPLLFEKLKDAQIRSDAALAILLGGDTDTVKRMIATFNDAGTEAMEDLKVNYNNSFGYWSDKNYELGDVARWVANAEACGHVKVRDTLQDWPKLLLMRALSGDFDNGPHSITRVQFRVRLNRDAKSGDEKKRTEAISILKFMKEKGVLMALRSEPGPWQEAAKKAFFEVMNPKASVESLPDAPTKK